jgi:chromosome partitioning protein
MTENYYGQQKIAKIFNRTISKTSFFEAEQKGEIPRGKRYRSGAINVRGWPIEALPLIGEKWGMIKRPSTPLALSVFTTKGGVLKTTLTYNLARMCALHNIKTCVVGLDIQSDITTTLGHFDAIDELEEGKGNADINSIIGLLNQTKGLSDVFNRTARLNDVIVQSKIPTLSYIPETPELAALNESLSNINRREYWLKEKIVDPLKSQFDLILMDCSPNWNRLITNSLVANDALLSPLECKINNFRNLKVFRHFLEEFKKDMDIDFASIFIPTRFSSNKRLSMEIKQWYLENIPGCTLNGMRESTFGEEANALKISVPEHVPCKSVANEFRDLLVEIMQRLGVVSSEILLRQKQQVDRELEVAQAAKTSSLNTQNNSNKDNKNDKDSRGYIHGHRA